MTLKELRDKLRAALTEARAIVEKAKTETRGMTPEETTAYQAKIAERDAIKGQIAVLEQDEELRSELDAMAPESQRPAADEGRRQREEQADADPGDGPSRIDVVERAHERYQRGDALGALVVARARFGMDRDAAIKWARTKYHGDRAPQVRAMQQSVFTAGGATVAENFVGQELIELLRAKAAVRRAGARSLPLTNGSATVPKITGGSQAFWGAEGQNIQASQIATGDIKLVEKKLTCLVPVSNDLLKNSNIEVDRLIRDDMVRGAANEEDIAFLRYDGTQNRPKGLYHWIGAAGRTNSAGTTLANVRTDIRVSKNRLTIANSPMERRAWFIHGRDINYMGWDLVDGNGNFAFKDLQQGDGQKLGGGTVHEDNNIPITLGGGTASEIYYVEMSEVFIGDNGELELEFFANATYVAADGQLRSGVSRDESVVRLIRKTDIAMRHSESGHVLENVTYGA